MMDIKVVGVAVNNRTSTRLGIALVLGMAVIMTAFLVVVFPYFSPLERAFASGLFVFLFWIDANLLSLLRHQWIIFEETDAHCIAE